MIQNKYKKLLLYVHPNEDTTKKSILFFKKKSMDRSGVSVSLHRGTRKTYALNGYRNFLCQFYKEISVAVRVGIRSSCSMNSAPQ